ncbi:MAG: DUF5683 domain-containing protein [Bacteroidota bacterium]|jgi:hypothetical protein
MYKGKFNNNRINFCFLIFAISLLYSSFFSAQDKVAQKDSIKKEKSTWSPAKKTTFYSAVLPGLGQIHNKKYWKVPVIYALMGGAGYFIFRNHIQYKEFQNAIIYRYDDIQGNESYSQYSVDNLVTLKRSFRRFRDFSILGMGLIYVLQIVDANVDAHLMNFDVENISMSVQPEIFPSTNIKGRNTFGLSLTIKPKISRP